MKIRLRIFLANAILASVILSVGGCSNDPLYRKRWGGSQFGQGDVARQANRAVYFDPYPLNDIGPEVVGARPREFARPLPEAVRNELDSRIPGQTRMNNGW